MCVKPAFEYFRAKFDQDLKPAMMAFKATRFFSPSTINMKPSPSLECIVIPPHCSNRRTEKGAARLSCTSRGCDLSY